MVEITYGGSAGDSARDLVLGYRFRVADGRASKSVYVYLVQEAYDDLSDGLSPEVISDAVIGIGLDRIVGSLQAGLFDSSDAGTRSEVILFRADAGEIRRRAAVKLCEYQVPDGRDLLCSASDSSDPSTVGSIGTRRVAPTSHALCRNCRMPPARLLCSQLTRPGVVGVVMGVDGAIRRELINALCNAGRLEIEAPAKCRPAQNGCWRLTVEAAAEQPRGHHSYLALLEELDFLNASWRITFGADLLRLGSMTGVASLAAPATDRASFSQCLSELADLLKRFDIPDSQIGEADSKIEGDHTLLRVEAAIRSHKSAGAADVDEAKGATKRLSTINLARRGLQHGNPSLLAKALDELGLPPFVSDWEAAWERVSAEAASAIAQIRKVVRRLQ